MNPYLYLGVDALGIIALTAVYFYRHRRRDLVVSFVGINVGVLAVTQVLSTSSVGAGLGLGLFGVLSIIRLRSSEIAQHEVAYYFAALAIGLIAGLGGTSVVPLALIALVVLALAIGDHPRLLPKYRQQVVLVDKAIPDETHLAAHLGQMLGASIGSLVVQRLDMVNDTTLVDVRYRLHTAPRHGNPFAGLTFPDSGEGPGEGHPERVTPLADTNKTPRVGS